MSTEVAEKQKINLSEFFEDPDGFVPIPRRVAKIADSFTRVSSHTLIKKMFDLFTRNKKNYYVFSIPELAKLCKKSDSTIQKALNECKEKKALLVEDVPNIGKLIMINKSENIDLLKRYLSGESSINLNFKMQNRGSVDATPPSNVSDHQVASTTLSEATKLPLNDPQTTNITSVQESPIDHSIIDPNNKDHSFIDKNDDEVKKVFENKEVSEKKYKFSNYLHEENYYKYLNQENLEGIARKMFDLALADRQEILPEEKIEKAAAKVGQVSPEPLPVKSKNKAFILETALKWGFQGMNKILTDDNIDLILKGIEYSETQGRNKGATLRDFINAGGYSDSQELSQNNDNLQYSEIAHIWGKDVIRSIRVYFTELKLNTGAKFNYLKNEFMTKVEQTSKIISFYDILGHFSDETLTYFVNTIEA